jgi:hypothetical protein
MGANFPPLLVSEDTTYVRTSTFSSLTKSGSSCLVARRVSTEVTFWHSAEYGSDFWCNSGEIPQNSAEFRGISPELRRNHFRSQKIPRNSVSAEFRGHPTCCPIEYGFGHCKPWMRHQETSHLIKASAQTLPESVMNKLYWTTFFYCRDDWLQPFPPLARKAINGFMYLWPTYYT